EPPASTSIFAPVASSTTFSVMPSPNSLTLNSSGLAKHPLSATAVASTTTTAADLAPMLRVLIPTGTPDSFISSTDPHRRLSPQAVEETANGEHRHVTQDIDGVISILKTDAGRATADR